MKTTSNKMAGDITEYEKWKLPLVNEPVSSPVTAEALENIQKQAYNEGFALGKKEGHAQKEQELENNSTALKNIIHMLTEPLSQLDDDVVEQLSQLSMIVAKQVIRRELHTEQGEIVGVVREAMSALPATTRKIVLSVHPEDASLIRNAFSLNQQDETDELHWKLIEDPMISRGGCTITNENSRVDATVEARLNRVISTLLGGERESDESL